MNKVTKFTTIETILVFAFFTVAFPMLAFLSTIIDFVSSLALKTLTFSLVASRVLCFSRFILNHESLLNRLFNKKSIFFWLNMTNNIIKCFDIVVVGKINIHMLPMTWQRTDHNLDLLLINNILPSSPQFTDHVRHDHKMLPHRVILTLLVTIKFEAQLIEPNSEDSTILNLHSIPNYLGWTMSFKVQHYIILHVAQQQNASHTIFALIGLICFYIMHILIGVTMLRFNHWLYDSF